MTESNSDCSDLPKRFIQALGQDIINRTKLDEAEIARIENLVRKKLIEDINGYYQVQIVECPNCQAFIAGDCKNWPPYNEAYCNICDNTWCEACSMNKPCLVPERCDTCNYWHCVPCGHIPTITQ